MKKAIILSNYDSAYLEREIGDTLDSLSPEEQVETIQFSTQEVKGELMFSVLIVYHTIPQSKK